jgi:purine-binding chemotaxis protein CheW
MLTTPFAPKRLAGKNEKNELLRLVVFNVADYWLGIPIGSVIKVIPCPPIVSNNNQGIGMITMGHYSITVVDLHFRFTQEPLPSPQFLILTFTVRREIFAIPTDRVPGMVEIPLESIVPLPPSYRQVDTLGCTSHMAVLEQEGITVYLLDLGSFA